MFSFLKKSIKSTISKISEKIKKEGKEETIEEKEEAREDVGEKEEVEEGKEEKKPELKPIEEPKKEVKVEKKKEPVKEERKDESFKLDHDVVEPVDIEEDKQIVEELPKKIPRKPFFSKLKEVIVTKRINEKQFEDFFYDLEFALMENNVAVEVIDKIKEDLKKEIIDAPIRRGKIEEKIIESLRISLKDLFKEPFDLIEKIKNKKPYVICFVGINGSGKTTTIAKIARMLKDKKYSIVLAASDTFRAASIEQMQKHADNLNVKLIKHDYGSDPAAVAYDAVQHAKSKGIDVVLIDTAGRMHSNINLIDEMKKIIKVAKPDLKIFVGESITGNDCVEQAKTFNDAVGIDCIILSKADVDEKGGAAVSVSYVTQKPIIFLGTGQEYNDLEEFKPSLIINNLGLE